MPTEVTDSPNRNWGCFLSILAVGVLATLAGVGAIYYVLVSPYLLRKESANWVETPCVIRESSVGHSDHSRTGERHDGFYSVDVVYDYRFDGKDYTSDRYDFY